MQLRKWMIVGAAALAFACGKDENNKGGSDTGGENNVADMGDDNNTTDMSDNNRNNNNGTDMTDPVDMTDPEDMTDPVDMTEDDMSGDDMGGDMADMADMGGPCTYNTFMPTTEEAEVSNDPNLRYYSYTATDSTNFMAPTIGFMTLELFPDFGATLGPQTFTFTGENYNVCHTCLLVDHCPGGNCNNGTRFLADSGTLEITALGTTEGDPLAATFTDLVLIEVEYDDQTFTTTPVPNGETWCINSMPLSANVVDITP